MIAQELRVGLTAQEPQQFVGNRLEVHPLGGHQRKTRGQVEAHLVAEHRERAGAGSIRLARAVAAHVAHEFEKLFHFLGFMPHVAGTPTMFPEDWLRRYAMNISVSPMSSIGSVNNIPMVNQPPAR